MERPRLSVVPRWDGATTLILLNGEWHVYDEEANQWVEPDAHPQGEYIKDFAKEAEVIGIELDEGYYALYDPGDGSIDFKHETNWTELNDGYWLIDTGTGQ